MKTFLLTALLSFASTVFAATPCPQFSPNGSEPVLSNPKLEPQTRVLCYADFAVLHSGVTHGPLWSAEYLTRDHLTAAKSEVRTNRFFHEPRLPAGEGAQLADFRKTGYDRGHMSPAGDRWNDTAMAESFSLANIVPQNPTNNRQIWARIESAVRRMASHAGEAYVVTGPMFHGTQLVAIGTSGVLVPTELFKVVYLPRQQRAFAIVVQNAATRQYSTPTVHQLEATSGIRFPGIPESLKDMRLTGGLNGV